MPLRDIVSAALSRPAGHVVETPVRELIEQVLESHGFAGPNDLRDLENKIDTLQARVVALEKNPLAERADALEQAARRLEEQSHELVRQVEHLRAERKAPHLELGPCPVKGCGARADRGRFCATHQHDWMRGDLTGFVGPDSLILVGRTTFQVDPAYAGHPYTTKGRGRSRTIMIDGSPVASTPL